MNNLRDQLEGLANPNQELNTISVDGFKSNELVVADEMKYVAEYKQQLRQLPEVQNLTSEIDVMNPNSVILFGQKTSEEISKISDELLKNMREVKAEEASEMLYQLTKIMDKFDIKELDDVVDKPSFMQRMFKHMGNKVASLFQKYDHMGMEVEGVYTLLRQYEVDIKESNANLKKLYDGNLRFYQQLERYIVAGELALEEIDAYYEQFSNDYTMDPNQQHMVLNKLQVCREMLAQRIYDLQVAENVALQAAPMIQMIQMSNFNLQRKINSSFIITLPIFKQCLAKAIMLKRQEIQSNSIKQLDDKTNELLQRNANMTVQQSINNARMASTSSVEMATLENTYSTIMRGIEETKAIQQQCIQQRKENTVRLEEMKKELKTKFIK